MAAPPRRDDSRIIIHFDYDCFYASVFEAENPVLKSLPLAVQQKQIIATCNYEARRRGLKKLQLVREAKKTCPDVVIVLGEDLAPFRDASKQLHAFLRASIWGDRVEKLGFDEVFLDVTEMIEYNVELLNAHDLLHSFFHLDKLDPTVGFAFDATKFSGPTFPASTTGLYFPNGSEDPLRLRLLLASHLARYLRDQLEHQKGYTASVGVSTSKLLAKLAGNVHKPSNQTTLLPPYVGAGAEEESNVTRFLDPHEIGKIPGIGYKLANRLKAHILCHDSDVGPHEAQRPTSISDNNKVTVRDVRCFPNMGPRLLEKILGGPGSPRDIGTKVWGLINGVDISEVRAAREIPTQISIEDSYGTLDTFDAVRKALVSLAASLVRRMRADLTEGDTDDDEQAGENKSSSIKRTRWLAHPRTLRLSTRIRSPELSGTRNYIYNRVSRSAPVPQFLFNLDENIDALAERLVHESILSMFRKLHPERAGWHLSLLNVAVTNMVEAAGERKYSSGRDIGKMFQQQETSLQPWKVTDGDDHSTERDFQGAATVGSEWDESKLHTGPQSTPARSPGDSSTDDVFAGGMADAAWVDSDGEDSTWSDPCRFCGTLVPHFASAAHELYHTVPE
ncbi:DNA polymerase iota, putative [Paecilomyces variotii No. 5]|uniref:DNA polymerase iota, putative n=1 Tax=Byssochlamys spectabilis (strain No. 5 / NBRC 109023) TaxID=1356009 RepID=V5FC66_BYSSN|nr:DNA polymerase iota, putative [Paecilomyces variotii No. 5]